MYSNSSISSPSDTEACIQMLSFMDFVGHANKVLTESIQRLESGSIKSPASKVNANEADLDHHGEHSPFSPTKDCESIYGGDGLFQVCPDGSRRNKIYFYYDKNNIYYNPALMSSQTLNLFCKFIYIYLYLFLYYIYLIMFIYRCFY